MPQFRLHTFELAGGRFYMLLPKLNSAQCSLIEARLGDLGYAVTVGKNLKAVRKSSAVNVAPEGLAWANSDLLDILGPLIPSLLRTKKEDASLESLAKRYFALRASEEGCLIRFAPRMESSALWDILRSDDLCAMTPDESLVYRYILARLDRPCTLLTDYPTEDCKVRRIGRRQYYESVISSKEASMNLREVGSRQARSCYLPRDSILRVDVMEPEMSGLKELLNGLGEWCYLRPR